MQRPDFNVEEVTKIIRGRRSMFCRSIQRK